MPEPLTPLERQVYFFLLDYLAEHTFQPSIREIGREFRIGSTKTTANILDRLERKGYLERGRARSRGVRLVGYGGLLSTRPVALYARAHAAPPTLRPEDIVQHISLDRSLLPTDDVFLARVTGEAASAYGVLAGDLAIVSPSTRAPDNTLVAIRIGDWIEVRAARHQGPALVLEAAEGDVVLGRADDYAVLGAVVGLIRKREAGGE